MCENQISVYALDCSVFSDAALFSECYALLPALRQRKIDAMRREADRRLSLGAGVLLHRLLPAGAEERIAVGAQGKPYLPGSDVKFNLSHAGDYAVCAIGQAEIGCDIEQARGYNLRVARRFFGASETALLEAAPPGERERLFFRLWTLKESYLKATGDGLARPLNEACFAFPEGRARYLGTDPFFFKEYSAPPQYYCAVCSTAPALFEDEIKYIDPLKGT